MSPTRPDDTMPDGDDFVAAEYVLGVLSDQERREVERRIESEPAFASIITRWQKQFDPLNDAFDPVAVRPALKDRIDDRLFGQQSAAKAPFWNSLAFWRGLAIALLALAAVGIGRDFLQHPASSGGQFVASMAADGSAIRTMALFDGQTKTLKITLTAGDIPADRALQLWLIAGEEAPASLGLINGSQVTELEVPHALAEKLQEGSTLAISVEPAGGSPAGTPTGAVVASGTVHSI